MLVGSLPGIRATAHNWRQRIEVGDAEVCFWFARNTTPSGRRVIE
jgi:hypothetical protein